MRVYKIFNGDWQPTPEKPFQDLAEAKRYVLALLETYAGPFHIVEWTVVDGPR
jgi:hypothetical protein